MKQYQDLLRHILANGIQQEDRTGTGTLGVFGYQMRFNLADGFPLVTTKKVHFKSVVHELLWMLKGDTNIKYLQDNGVSIWDEWADENGDLGAVYGHQWRNFGGQPFGVYSEGVDQIADVIELIKSKPHDRGMVVTAWNPSDVGKVALRWCHCLFQFKVLGGKLHCQLYQRSADTFLGVPFNIASYALLTHMVAQQCGLEVGEFIWTGGDVHLYLNHIEVAKEQLLRDPRPLPKLVLNHKPSIDGYLFEDVILTGYDPHPAIKAPVSV